MSTRNKSNGKRKRAPKGQGRLYKRGPGGKEYPADSPANLPFWIAYSIPNPDGGTGQRIREPLRDENGKQITDRKKAEAERLRILAPYTAKDKVESLRQIQAKLQDAEHRLVEAERDAAPTITISAAWEAYLAAPNRPDTGEATLDQYAIQFNRFTRWLSKYHKETIFLRDVTKELAEEYAANIITEGRSANTFNKYMNLLQLVFRVLKDKAKLTTNPWEMIQRKKVIQQGRRELTIDELKTVCEKATGDLRLLFALGIYTGLRLGDCSTLRWGEVDLRRGIIRRIPSKTARRNPKPVLCPIHQVLHNMLAEIPQQERGEYVLPRIAKDYARHHSYVTDRIQKHFTECGLRTTKPMTKGRLVSAVEVGFHSLRHSFVSLCRDSNAPLSVVEAIVGHSNPAMTRHYTHTSEIEAARAIAALPSIASDNPVPRPVRDPLPPWARELAEKLTAKNVKTIKAELLKGGVA